MPIHNVNMEGVHARIFQPFCLFAQRCQIPAHDRRRDMGGLDVGILNAFGHTVTSAYSSERRAVTGTTGPAPRCSVVAVPATVPHFTAALNWSSAAR